MTLKRIYTYSVLIGIVMWTMWAVDMSRPGTVDRFGKIKGTDFLQFYVGGSFAREGRLERFYEVSAMHARAEALVPASRDTIYIPVQSPQTALLLAPLSALPYTLAVAIWFAIVAALYAFSCRLLWRRAAHLRPYRGEAIAVALAFPGLYSTVLNGQSSAVSLTAMTAALIALQRDRKALAGAALGCLVFKPHWYAAVVAIFLAAREWRLIAASLASAAAQIALACLAGSTAAMVAYANVLLSVQRIGELLEPRPGDSLRGFFRVFVPIEPWSLMLYAAASVVVVVAAARTWRADDAPFAVRASAIVVGTILISPHAFGYDLILLAPVYLLIADWLAGEHAAADGRLHDGDGLVLTPAQSAIVWSLAALFFAPLLTAVAAPIRLQFSVTAMAALLAGAYRLRGVHDANRSIVDANVAAGGCV